MTVTMNGSEPRIIVLARASLAIARAFASIVRRRRNTSERLLSVSARLPPVSRCTLRAMMKKRNSGTNGDACRDGTGQDDREDHVPADGDRTAGALQSRDQQFAARHPAPRDLVHLADVSAHR